MIQLTPASHLITDSRLQKFQLVHDDSKRPVLSCLIIVETCFARITRARSGPFGGGELLISRACAALFHAMQNAMQFAFMHVYRISSFRNFSSFTVMYYMSL